MKEPANHLADWFRAHYRGDAEALTHLKLQKLVFYGYGALLAYDLEAQLGSVVFEAWAHGPVSRSVWREYRTCGGRPIESLPTRSVLPVAAEITEHLHDVLRVYGPMTAWQLRQESHLEAPWKETEQGLPIPEEKLKKHFEEKFKEDSVRLPRYLLNSADFALDGVPLTTYSSLRALGEVVQRARRPRGE